MVISCRLGVQAQDAQLDLFRSLGNQNKRRLGRHQSRRVAIAGKSSSQRQFARVGQQRRTFTHSPGTNMPQHSSRKKSGLAPKEPIPRSKSAKRPRVDPKSLRNPSENAAPSEKKKKGKQSVSFAPAAAEAKKSVKSVRIHDSSLSSPSGHGKGKTPAAATKVKRTAPSTPTPAPVPRAFTIVVGSYEKLLYGVQGTYASTPSEPSSSTPLAPTPTLKPVFIFPAHVASVKAVAASPDGGKWLATGSSDEIIKVWDLKRRKEVGGLMQHQGPFRPLSLSLHRPPSLLTSFRFFFGWWDGSGTITHLSFASQSHLISASEDGTIALFHARDWTVLLTLKGHKGRVNSVAVHPTGKVALSVGKDRALRMWDLMRGKPSASTLLGKEGELVRWSMDGREFMVQSGNTLDVYRTVSTVPFHFFPSIL